MKKIKIHQISLVLLLIFCTSTFAQEKHQKPNVLMIIVDDLRPELNCYGQSHIKSPNIDNIASNGLVFSNSFCNVPVCGASRASLLTGVRPTATRFVNYLSSADIDLPGHLSLPRYLKQNGYTTISIGKVYHNENDDIDGWSEKPMPMKEGVTYINPESIAQKKVALKGTRKVGPAWESGNTEDDEVYRDGKIAQKAIEKLEILKDSESPFFLAVGFIKPHLPFCAPKKYYDLYDRDEIELADNYFFPENAPQKAFINSGELRSRYTGVPEERLLPEAYALGLKHAYFACVSYTDAMIGKVMDKLKVEGLDKNTIVVLWGDHGWNLGEHTIWGKHNNFEDALRAPIIVSAPGYPKDIKSNSLVEFVDVYPSIAEYCGLEIPVHCQGKSFLPIMKNPEENIKDEVFCRWKPSEGIHTMKYAYTEWRDKETGELQANMLYDLLKDPEENINVADDPNYMEVVEELSQKIKANMATR